jgi:hypothetical protein
MKNMPDGFFIGEVDMNHETKRAMEKSLQGIFQMCVNGANKETNSWEEDLVKAENAKAAAVIAQTLMQLDKIKL